MSRLVTPAGTVTPAPNTRTVGRSGGSSNSGILIPRNRRSGMSTMPVSPTALHLPFSVLAFAFANPV